MKRTAFDMLAALLRAILIADCEKSTPVTRILGTAEASHMANSPRPQPSSKRSPLRFFWIALKAVRYHGNAVGSLSSALAFIRSCHRSYANLESGWTGLISRLIRSIVEKTNRRGIPGLAVGANDGGYALRYRRRCNHLTTLSGKLEQL